MPLTLRKPSLKADLLYPGLGDEKFQQCEWWDIFCQDMWDLQHGMGGSGGPSIANVINIGGGGGIGFPGIGGPTLTMPPIGGTGSGGKSTPISIAGSVAGNVLSSVLGIPAINWGRLAAFLLGLLFIAGGLYLLKPVQQVVNQTVKEGIKGLAEF